MQNFERDGVVSLWVFREAENPADADKDVLKDLGGVDFYDVDSQEGAIAADIQPLSSILAPLSYSQSFIDSALGAAERLGIKEAYGVLAQFDFAYDPRQITKQIGRDPVFIGYFDWHD